jgi:hypothetical protein
MCASEFATSSILLVREASSLEQRHLLEAVQDLNALRRDFDKRFPPRFEGIADMHNRLYDDSDAARSA